MLSAGLFSLLVPTTHLVQAAGNVYGQVYWTDQYGNLRPMAWATVTADDGASTVTVAYTTDGAYQMWLAPGTYNITASSDPGFYPESASVFVSQGSSTSQDFTLEPTGKPIPELTPWMQPVIVLAALLITAVAVRRLKKSAANSKLINSIA